MQYQTRPDTTRAQSMSVLNLTSYSLTYYINAEGFQTLMSRHDSHVRVLPLRIDGTVDELF